MSLTSASMVLIDLMTYRADALFYRVASDLYPVSDAAAWEHDQTESWPSGTHRPELSLSLEYLKFARTVARPLVNDLAELLWVQLEEELIEASECNLSGLGRFEVRWLEDEIQINLHAAPSIWEDSFIDPSDSARDLNAELVSICVKNLKPSLSQYERNLSPTALVANADFVELNAAQVVAEGLSGIMRSVSLQEEKFVSSRKNSPRGYADLFGAKAHAGALAAYYAYVTTFRDVLSRYHHLEIPMVGVFLNGLKETTFRSDAYFHGILSSNFRDGRRSRT